LPYPVVLPQRRPKTRSRGFIRAYAPILSSFGITEPMFLDFLSTANKSCQAKGWLGLINLAALGAMFLPHGISLVVSVAVQIATSVVVEVDGRRRSNNFFDEVNREFFIPRGLFCLVMTWNPEVDAPYVRFDMNDTIVTAMDKGGDGVWGKLKHKLKTSNAEAYGNQLFPEVVAPLVFPELDLQNSVDVDEETRKKYEGLKGKMEFAAGYRDKRAQAKFINENPDSALIQGEKPTFASRYGDPTHPANEGSTIALLTGGHVTMGGLRGGQRHGRLGDRRAGRRGVRNDDDHPPRRDRGAGLRGVTGGGPVTMVQNVLKKVGS
ncbi:hypothetical protein BO78DRAFT_330356, partial [Aspergillus sclerotiicarbonarius CBS 121057]